MKTTKVLGGSTAGLLLSWETSLFQNGILSYLDGISIHPYTASQTAAPETGPIDQQVSATENLIRQYNSGQPKLVWITELGWPTCCGLVDEATQAAYVVRGGTLALAGGAQKYIVYDFMDDGTNPNFTEHHFGVIRLPNTAGSYTPKPAYTAYAVMARQLTGETFAYSQCKSQDSAGEFGTAIWVDVRSENTDFRQRSDPQNDTNSSAESWDLQANRRDHQHYPACSSHLAGQHAPLPHLICWLKRPIRSICSPSARVPVFAPADRNFTNFIQVLGNSMIQLKALKLAQVAKSANVCSSRFV